MRGIGAAAGKTSDGMNIFASMGPAEWKKAEALVPITHVTVAAEARSLYAEATIRTRQSHVRAVIKETHDRISKIEAYPFSKDNFQLPAPNAFLRSLTLRHMLAFAQNIPGGRLDFSGRNRRDKSQPHEEGAGNGDTEKPPLIWKQRIPPRPERNWQ